MAFSLLRPPTRLFVNVSLFCLWHCAAALHRSIVPWHRGVALQRSTRDGKRPHLTVVVALCLQRPGHHQGVRCSPEGQRGHGEAEALRHPGPAAPQDLRGYRITGRMQANLSGPKYPNSLKLIHRNVP